MIMDYYCIWEKGYHCYSPSVAKSHMLMMLLRYIILCFLAKISTYFSTFDYFFVFLSLAVWWDEVTEMVWMKKKGSYIFSELSMPSQLLCRNNPGGNYKKIFKTKCMNFGATEQLLGHISGAERWENCFLEVMEDWKWDWRQLSSPRLTVCPAHFVFALV